MIPDIGLMISAYIIFRMIEVFLFRVDRYRGDGARIAACALALLVILFVFGVAIDLLSTSASISTSLPGLQ